MQLVTFTGEPWADYGLVDSGHGRKLERYGRFRFIRPEPQALWAPAKPDWQAHGEFVPGSDEDGGEEDKYIYPRVPRTINLLIHDVEASVQSADCAFGSRLVRVWFAFGSRLVRLVRLVRVWCVYRGCCVLLMNRYL